MNGVVLIDKPPGKTSHDVVIEVKRSLGVRKAGHTGTLDPLATGVLPVCINEATKLVPFFSLDTKEYLVTMLLGIKTDTQDVEGEIIESCEPRAGLREIEHALHGFIGEIEQIPPRYSAIKFRGKSLYKWAREGKPVDAQPRVVEIFDLALGEVSLPYVSFKVSCSKGTYMRSLCSDIGDVLGCGACLSGLRRTRSGAFLEEAAVSLERLGSDNVIPMVDALPEISVVDIDHALAEKLKGGYQPVADMFRMCNIPFVEAGDMIKFVDERSRLVAIARMIHASDRFSTLDEKIVVMKIMRVFNYES